MAAVPAPVAPVAAAAARRGGGSGGGGGNPSANLITNGDFAAGMANWRVDSGNGNVNNGRFCLTNPGSGTLLAWESSRRAGDAGRRNDLPHLL